MMFLNSLTNWIRERFPSEETPQRPSARLRLEELEDRCVPAFVTATYLNPTVQITPGFTVTETVTATVTTFQGFDPSTGQITPIPANATNPTSGIVLFNLNNQVKSANLNSSGQATATFQIPILAFFASQQLDIFYNGAADLTNNNFWLPFTFDAPLYTNFDNLLLQGKLTFGQLTPQQVYAFEINEFQNPNPTPPPMPLAPQTLPTTLRPYYSVNGETNTLGNNLVSFNYVDPGIINTVTAFGVQFPGFVAIQLGAYKGLTS
ncbi:MAG TPA: hypothetical protein VH592_08770 [Gemmataceae bacterium]|jgi:hypothetical protein